MSNPKLLVIFGKLKEAVSLTPPKAQQSGQVKFVWSESNLLGWTRNSVKVVCVGSWDENDYSLKLAAKARELGYQVYTDSEALEILGGLE